MSKFMTCVAVHKAATEGDLLSLSSLLRANDWAADAELPKSANRSALHAAVAAGQEAAAALLLRHDAARDALNADKLTPLQLAKKLGRGSLVALLEASPEARGVALPFSAVRSLTRAAALATRAGAAAALRQTGRRA